MRHQFTVHGAGKFPLDMLRYDECWPLTGEDAAAIASGDRHHRSITLVTENRSGPTQGRWGSFSWPVLRTRYPQGGR